LQSRVTLCRCGIGLWELGRLGFDDDGFAVADGDLLPGERPQLGCQVAGATLLVDPRFVVAGPEIAEHGVGVDQQVPDGDQTLQGGMRVSLGATRSGGAATGEVLFEATGLSGRVDMLWYRLRDALARLADGSIDALVWSGGVPTPAIADLDTELPLRVLDTGALAAPMSQIAGYPYVVRRVPTCGYVPPGIRSIGVPNLLLCRHDVATDLVAAVVDVLATEAPQLVPPYVRGLQYLDAPSMIQTGLIPLHPDAVGAYRKLHP
jgi:NMT1-like family